MEPMIELREVTKHFGDSVAVDRVDLQVRAGEFLTLLGPSGCGKTTMLRMISGFETPTSGAVYLDGRDVTALPPYRRDVNQVFQSYALFPHLSVWENVAFGLKMKRVAKAALRERVARALEMVSLTGFEARGPDQLSGGQKQRVALARALVCEPKVLLLDEPLAALDAKLRRAMQVELKRLQSRLGITFLFVTHDQDEALVMSDRIAVVNRGRIEQIGAVADIYHKPATTFVADFIGEANVMTGRVIASDGTSTTVRVSPGAVWRIAHDGLTNGADVRVSVRPEKIAIARQAMASENVFEATVREVIFRGPTDQLLVETSGGLELAILRGNGGGGAERFAKGERVYCQVRTEDVVVLTDVPAE